MAGTYLFWLARVRHDRIIIFCSFTGLRTWIPRLTAEIARLRPPLTSIIIAMLRYDHDFVTIALITVITATLLVICDISCYVQVFIQSLRAFRRTDPEDPCFGAFAALLLFGFVVCSVESLPNYGSLGTHVSA